MINIIFLLEEMSAKAMLQCIIPRIFKNINNINIKYLTFDGK